MGRILWTAGAALVTLFAAGCATGPLQENPLRVRPLAPPLAPTENPVYIALGPQPEHYALVFEKVLDVIDDYFEVAYENRYDGRIETHPSIAPGLEQPWKPGSPDLYQRTLAFLQSIRHRAIVQITVADDGGYFVDVKVLKELEDNPTPIRATPGGAVFRSVPTVERQFEVVEPGQFDRGWIPIGRDYKLEQIILCRIAQFDLSGLKPPAP